MPKLGTFDTVNRMDRRFLNQLVRRTSSGFQPR